MITCAGCQPSFVEMTYAWMVGVGVAKMTNVSAPEAFSFATCAAGGVSAERVALGVDDLRLVRSPSGRP